eukprot:54503_1
MWLVVWKDYHLQTIKCANMKHPHYIGSHYDTVHNAGTFDGTLGIISSIAVSKVLNMLRYPLPFALEIVAFEDEEGCSVFDSDFIGSLFYSGTLYTKYPTINDLFDLNSIEQPKVSYFDRLSHHFSALSDRTDIISRKALLNQILDQSTKPRSDIFGFIEIHIEQGPVLEINDIPIGVVSSINGRTAMTLKVYGQAGHAGTVPMHLRHDALFIFH